MDFVKREFKFLAVVMFTLLGMAIIHSCTVDSTRAEAKRSLDAATKAENALAEAVATSRNSVASAKTYLIAADEGVPALKAMTNAFREEAGELKDAIDPLVDAIAYNAGPTFSFDAAFQPTGPNAYEIEVERFFKTRFQQRFDRNPAYQFVKSPNFTQAWNKVSQELGFATYEVEANAYAGLQNEPAAGGAGARAFGSAAANRSNPPAASDGMSPEDRKLKEAEAKAKMQLILLSIVNKIIEAGRDARVAKVDSILFIPVDEATRARFRVERQAPSFYRPIRVEVGLSASEGRLMQFIENCLSPTFNGATAQFMGMDALELVAKECLNPEPPDDLVTARISFTAYLIDRNQKFEKDEQEAGSNRRSTTGRTPWRWRR